MKELRDAAFAEAPERVRRPGAGRLEKEETDRELVEDLNRLIDRELAVAVR